MCIKYIIFPQSVFVYFLLFQHTSKTFIDFIPGYNKINIKKENTKEISNNKNIDKVIKSNNKEIIKKEIYNNNVLIKEIDELRKQLNDERNINKILKYENKELKNLINKLKQDYGDIIKKYESDNNKLKNKNKELKKLIDKQKQEIDDYILKSKNLSNNKAKSFNPEDKIISVLFMTQGNNDIFNYSMPCKTTDLFIKLEEKLYQDFPKYRNIKKIFMVNTNKVLRFKTLEENKIKNNDIISLFISE